MSVPYATITIQIVSARGPGGWSQVDVTAEDLVLPLEDIAKRFLVPAFVAAKAELDAPRDPRLARA